MRITLSFKGFCGKDSLVKNIYEMYTWTYLVNNLITAQTQYNYRTGIENMHISSFLNNNI